MLVSCLFVILTFLNSTIATSSQTSAIQVPKGNSIVLDGRIAEEEWKGAYKQQLKGGGELLLLQDQSTLYIGVKGTTNGWSHVYLIDGERVLVLHASAALGTAIYRRADGELWQPIQPFDWSLRQTDSGEETTKARTAFVDTDGWLANNNMMGSGKDFEFKLGQRLIKARDAKLAVVYVSDDKSAQYWPSTLTDDCLNTELVIGNTPSDLKFNQSSWATLRF